MGERGVFGDDFAAWFQDINGGKVLQIPLARDRAGGAAIQPAAPGQGQLVDGGFSFVL